MRYVALTAIRDITFLVPTPGDRVNVAASALCHELLPDRLRGEVDSLTIGTSEKHDSVCSWIPASPVAGC